MKILLVFNPRAAGGRAVRRLDSLGKLLEAANIDYELGASEYAGHIEQLVRERDLGDFDAVVVAGGDGTLFQALNGLMAHPPGERVPLGLIPIGTGNAFSRDLGLKADKWQEGVDLLVKGTLRPVDVGQIKSPSGTFYFLNIAGFGFVTDAGLTASRLKLAGKSAYTLATLWRCLVLRSHALEIEVDGELLREDNLFVEVSNSRFTGTSFLIAPGAKIDDGLLDVTSVRRLSRFRLLRLFPSVFRGEHVHYDEVTTLQGRSITIHSPPGYGLMVDGEFRGETPARIDCLPGAVEIFAA